MFGQMVFVSHSYSDPSSPKITPYLPEQTTIQFVACDYLHSWLSFKCFHLESFSISWLDIHVVWLRKKFNFSNGVIPEEALIWPVWLSSTHWLDQGCVGVLVWDLNILTWSWTMLYSSPYCPSYVCCTEKEGASWVWDLPHSCCCWSMVPKLQDLVSTTADHDSCSQVQWL